MKPALIKSLTLLSFMFLITTFLLYRMGKFDTYLPGSQTDLQSSPNGGTVNSQKKDSVIIKADSAQLQILSSSKSMIVTNRKYVFFDTAKNKSKFKPVPVRSPVIMSSSKSGHIFPTPIIYHKPDTIKFDIKKISKKKN
jgi:hypothetical protein